MFGCTRLARPKHRPRPRRTLRLLVETLEVRSLPSTTSWPGLLHPVAQATPTETLDRAQDLGNLSVTRRAEAVGALGSGPAGAADVGWYSFTLTSPARVTITTLDQAVAGALPSVISLYNSDPFDFSDPYDVFHYRLLNQAVSTPSADAAVSRNLAAGTYYVAVSGTGNQYFCPLMTGSGYPGSVGSYGLLVTAQDLGLGSADNPILLAADPGSGTVLADSPLELRLDFSAPLDPSTVNLGQNVHLTYNPTGAFSDGHDQDMPLGSFNLSTAGNELQLFPAAPLAPGFYRVTVDPSVLDPAGDPVQAATVAFQVQGIEGNSAAGAAADDTVATAHDLGDVTTAGLVHVAGVIGDDPTDPVPFDPSDVDLYHFRISGPGRFAFAAEVFAGRLGSPLDSALWLYEPGADGQLHLITANDNTGNPTETDNGAYTPLYTDSAVFAGLTAGDYYLAVTSSGTTFNPSQSHSGQGGFSTGPYVLNLLVQPSTAPPQVVATTPAAGAVLTAPPTQLVVQFNEPVNLQQLAYQAYQQTSQGQLSSVYLLGANGSLYYPRLLGFDMATDQATFQMLDALPNGSYQLHLSGPLGLTDFAGNPLIGNTPGGDYVVRFTVHGAARGTAGNPLLWTYQPGTYNPDHVQNLGVLFPRELQAGVTISRNGVAAPLADYYRLQVLQDQTYTFTLSGLNLPAGVQLLLVDAADRAVPDGVLADGVSLMATLRPGNYGIEIEASQAASGKNLAYQIQIAMEGAPDQPAPLTAGPAPAISFHLAGAASAAASVPRVAVPSSAASVNVALAAPSATTVNVALVAPSAAGPGFAVPEGSVAGLVVGLGAGPLGGVTSLDLGELAAAPDRIVIPGGTEPVLEGIVQLAVLTQAGGLGDDPGDAGEAGGARLLQTLANWLSEGVSGAAQSWEQARDVVFGVADWLEHLPAAAAVGTGLLLEDLPQDPGPASGPGVRTEPAEQSKVPTEEAGTPGQAGEIGASSLLVVGAAGLAPPRRREDDKVTR